MATGAMRVQGKCELFCQVCYDKGGGYTLYDEREGKRIKYAGWGGHTYQKCWMFQAMDKISDERKKYVLEAHGPSQALAACRLQPLLGIEET